VLIGIPARPDLLAFRHRLGILVWLVVPVLRGGHVPKIVPVLARLGEGLALKTLVVSRVE
jgi:hypothetical protein